MFCCAVIFVYHFGSMQHFIPIGSNIVTVYADLSIFQRERERERERD